jgi:hypothetical protein
MRLLADGKIRWCFWPPNAESLQDRQELGIWIGDFMPDVVETEDDYSDHELTHETTAGETITEEDEEDEDEDEESEDEGPSAQATSFFAALDVEDDDEEETDSEESDE